MLPYTVAPSSSPAALFLLGTGCFFYSSNTTMVTWIFILLTAHIPDWVFENKTWIDEILMMMNDVTRPGDPVTSPTRTTVYLFSLLPSPQTDTLDSFNRLYNMVHLGWTAHSSSSKQKETDPERGTQRDIHCTWKERHAIMEIRHLAGQIPWDCCMGPCNNDAKHNTNMHRAVCMHCIRKKIKKML